MLGIFNYQKSSSSVVNSTLYALRTSTKAREVLGDEIYFAQKIPWISDLFRTLKRSPQIKNIYFELGSTFNMTSLYAPETCMHMLGQMIQVAGVDHILWGTMLLVLTICGPGKIAVDTWLERRFAPRES